MSKVWKVLRIVIIFAAILFPAIYVNTAYGYLPGLFLLFSILLSLFCMQVVYKRLSIESDFQNDTCERTKSVSVRLNVANNSRLVCARAAANIFISDPFGGEDAVSQMSITLAPKEKSGFGLNMQMPHIGVYKAGIRKMELWDFFGFFRRQVPVSGEFEIFVSPKIRPIEEYQKSEQAMAEASRDSRMTALNGMDYVGVREYAQGDSMKQIHWKLSAHSLGYMTKLQESSRQVDYAVILDFAAEKNNDSEILMDIQDTLIETALSLIEEIAQMQNSYSLIYCSRENELRRAVPQGRQDDIMLVKDFSVITPDPEPGYPDAESILIDEGAHSGTNTNVIICTSRVTDVLLQELLRIRRQRKVPELFQIIPAETDSRELEHIRARLRILDDAAIRYHLVYTTDAGGTDA